MTRKEAINQAFKNCGGDVSIGDIVAHQSHKLTHRLVDIVGGLGVCKLPDGTTHTWPTCELADPNKVKTEAIRLMVLTQLTT